jgi:hypothetical protein
MTKATAFSPTYRGCSFFGHFTFLCACGTTMHSGPLEDVHLSATGIGMASGKVAAGVSFSLAGTVTPEAEPIIQSGWVKTEEPKRPYYWQFRGDFIGQIILIKNTSVGDVGWAGSLELRGGIEAWKNNEYVMVGGGLDDGLLDVIADCSANLYRNFAWPFIGVALEKYDVSA